MRICWHGHACWEITNEITLVTDPHDGKSLGISAPDVAGDIILVSHDHYDLIRTLQIVKMRGTAHSRTKSAMSISSKNGIELAPLLKSRT